MTAEPLRSLIASGSPLKAASLASKRLADTSGSVIAISLAERSRGASYVTDGVLGRGDDLVYHMGLYTGPHTDPYMVLGVDEVT